MALQVRTKASGRISKLIALPMLLLALVAQPMYGLVDGVVVGAVSIPSSGDLSAPTGLTTITPKNANVDVTNGFTKFDYIRNSWSGVAGASSYKYEFKKPAGLPTYSRVTASTHVEGVLHNASSPNGTYGFRVQAVDGNGVAGDWSDWSLVTYDTIAPQTEISIEAESRENGHLLNPIAVTGVVSSSEPNIKSHWFEITNPDGSLSYSHNLNTNSLTYSFNLDTSKGNGDYKLRYVATDRAGNRNDVNGSTVKTVAVDNTPFGMNVPEEGAYIKGDSRRININISNPESVRGGYLMLNKATSVGNPRNDDRTNIPLRKDVSGQWYALVDTTNLVKYGERDSGGQHQGDGKYLFKVEVYGYNTPHGYYGNGSAWLSTGYYFIVDNTAPRVSIVSAPKGTVNGSPSFKWSENVKVEVKDDNLGKTELFRAGETEAIQTHEGAVFNLDKDRSLQGRFYLVHTDGANNKSEPVYFELHQLGPKVTDVQGVGADGVTVMSENGNTKISFNVSKNGGTDIVHVEVRAKQGTEWSGKDILALKDESGEEGRYEFDLAGIVNGNHGKTYIVQVQVKNAAGEHATHQYIIKVDNETTTPTINSVVGSGTTRVVSGIAEPGVTVFVTVGGVTKETLVDESGEWSVRFENITPGQRTAHAFAEDTLGNRSEEVTSRFMVVVTLVETPQVNEPVELMSPLPAGGNSSPAAAASPFVSFFTLPGEEAAGVQTEASDDDASDVLGAQTGEEGEASTGAVVSEGWKIFGLMWYWWLLILAALAGIWWIIVATLRRRGDDEATA